MIIWAPLRSERNGKSKTGRQFGQYPSRLGRQQLCVDFTSTWSPSPDVLQCLDVWQDLRRDLKVPKEAGPWAPSSWPWQWPQSPRRTPSHEEWYKSEHWLLHQCDLWRPNTRDPQGICMAPKRTLPWQGLTFLPVRLNGSLERFKFI